MTDRSVTIRTRHDRPATVAAAVVPDNTAEMSTRVEDGRVYTTIERPTTSGLRATATDYIANVQVASDVAAHADRTTQTHS
jgi:hypothetical protein